MTKVDLEHVDAPVLKKYSLGEFRELLSGFSRVRIVPERFPVKTRLHGGLKGTLYNTLFVGMFNAHAARADRPLRLASAGLL